MNNKSFNNNKLFSIHNHDNAFTASSLSDENANYWIGLSRASINDSWSWVDGSAVQYVNWQDGQPLYEEGYHCVQYAHENGKWETMTCDSHRCYICKIKKGIIGEEIILLHVLVVVVFFLIWACFKFGIRSKSPRT